MVVSKSFTYLSLLVLLSKEQIITLIDAVKFYAKRLDILSDVQMIFQSCAKLKYVSVFPQNRDENRNSVLIDWVELLNNYRGYICFGHNVLDGIPKRMLTYDRQAYSCPFSTGVVAKTTYK